MARGDSRSVEVRFEAEPGVETEGNVRVFDRLLHGNAFADSTAHGFFSPNRFAGFCCGNGHVGVPVGRGGGVNDVDVIAGDKLAEVVVGFDVVVALGLDLLHAGVESLRVDIAEAQNTAGHPKVG